MAGLKYIFTLLVTLTAFKPSHQQSSRGFFIYPNNNPNPQFRRCNEINNFAFTSIHFFEEANSLGCQCGISMRQGDQITEMRIQQEPSRGWVTTATIAIDSSAPQTIAVSMDDQTVSFDGTEYNAPLALQIVGPTGYMYLTCQDGDPTTAATTTTTTTTTEPTTTTTTTQPTTTTTTQPTTTTTTQPTTTTTTQPITTTATTASTVTTTESTTPSTAMTTTQPTTPSTATTTPATTPSSTPRLSTTMATESTATAATTTTPLPRTIPRSEARSTSTQTLSQPSTQPSTQLASSTPLATSTMSSTDGAETTAPVAQSSSDRDKDDSTLFFIVIAFVIIGVILILAMGLTAVVACRRSEAKKAKDIDDEERYDVIEHDYNAATNGSTIQSTNAGVLGSENPSYRPDFEASILAKGGEQHSVGDSGHGGSVNEELNRVHFSRDVRDSPSANPTTENYSVDGYDENQNNADRNTESGDSAVELETVQNPIFESNSAW